MAQLQVHRVPCGPLVVAVQSDYVPTGTRVVAPLTPPDGEAPIKGLRPVVEVNGERLALRVTDLGAVAAAALGLALADLSHERDAILRAVDLMIFGF